MLWRAFPRKERSNIIFYLQLTSYFSITTISQYFEISCVFCICNWHQILSVFLQMTSTVESEAQRLDYLSFAYTENYNIWTTWTLILFIFNLVSKTSEFSSMLFWTQPSTCWYLEILRQLQKCETLCFRNKLKYWFLFIYYVVAMPVIMLWYVSH